MRIVLPALLVVTCVAFSLATTVDNVDRHLGEIYTRHTTSDYAKVSIAGGFRASVVECPKKSGKVCNDQGVCVGASKGKASYCLCEDGFFGAACQSKHCPDAVWKDAPGVNQALARGVNHMVDYLECNGHGTCHHEGGGDGNKLPSQSCLSAYTTASTSATLEQCKTLCINAGCMYFSRHGSVADATAGYCFITTTGGPTGSCSENVYDMRGGTVAAGSCDCTWPYSGVACKTRSCPEYEGRVCNNQGSCNTRADWNEAGSTTNQRGTCTCNWPFYGESCERAHCPSARYRSSVDDTTAGALKTTQWTHKHSYIECSSHGICHSETGLAASNKHASLNNAVVNSRSLGGWGFCQCLTTWSGPDCSVKDCPMYDGKTCNGKGSCEQVGNTAACRCTFPYHGASCENIYCPGAAFANPATPNTKWHGVTVTGQCSGHGTCHSGKTGSIQYPQGTCECQEGYLLEDCSLKRTPVSQGHFCSGQGSVKDGICTCTWPYFHGPDKACEYKMCPGALYQKSSKVAADDDFNASQYTQCNGHGVCNMAGDTGVDVHSAGISSQGFGGGLRSTASSRLRQGTCDCQDGWTGPDCSTTSCPSYGGQTCNGQGMCDNSPGNTKPQGVCTCNARYFGASCEHRHCDGFTEKLTQRPTRPLLASDFWECHGHTKEVRGHCNHFTGTCNCLNAFTGSTCEHIPCLSHLGRECNGQGTCNHASLQRKQGHNGHDGNRIAHARCECNTYHEGMGCEHRKCPTANGALCAGHGTCNQVTGDCACNAGYWENDCASGSGINIDL